MLHPTMPVVAFVFAAAIGLALGTLGGGGSVLTVPVLVYLLAYDPKTAVPTSLGVVGAASLVGAIGHWRAGRVDPRIAMLFGAVTMASAFAGARLALNVPGGVQLVILAIVILVVAILMLRSSGAAGPSRPSPAPVLDGDNELLHHVRRLAPLGVGVGLLTGLIGVGGGFLIVPALVLWGGVAMPTAVGTSLVVITLNCAAGLVGYAGRVAIPWGDTALFTLVAVIGSAVGVAVVGGVHPHRLRQVFAVFLLFVGTFVLYRNRTMFVIHGVVPKTAATTPASPARVRSTAAPPLGPDSNSRSLARDSASHR